MALQEKLLLVGLLLGTSTALFAQGVVCNRFEVKDRIEGDHLFVSVDSDLPADTVVSIGVQRRYWWKGSSGASSLEYAFKSGPVKGWSSPLKISIGDDRFKRLIDRAVASRKRLGRETALGRIHEEIWLRVVTPSNQPNPNFGDRNRHFTGKMVRSEGGFQGVKVIRRYWRPVGAKSSGSRPPGSGNPDGGGGVGLGGVAGGTLFAGGLRSVDTLKVGSSFGPIGDVPLLPQMNPLTGEIKSAVTLDPKSWVFVLGVFPRGDKTWLRVVEDVPPFLRVGWVVAETFVGRKVGLVAVSRSGGNQTPLVPASMSESKLRGARRLSFKALLPRGLSAEELESELTFLLRSLQSQHKADAVTLRVWQVGEPAVGSYSVAKGVLAPEGKWGKAKKGTAPGDLEVAISSRKSYFKDLPVPTIGDVVVIGSKGRGVVEMSVRFDRWGKGADQTPVTAGSSGVVKAVEWVQDGPFRNQRLKVQLDSGSVGWVHGVLVRR